jgi:hypothetical protein
MNYFVHWYDPGEYIEGLEIFNTKQEAEEFMNNNPSYDFRTISYGKKLFANRKEVVTKWEIKE